MNQAEFTTLVIDAIAPAHRVLAKAARIVHQEIKHDGTVYSLVVLIGSTPHVAFSLDVSGLEPFGIFKKTTAGITCRNDLTILCWRDNEPPVAFVIELKHSKTPLSAQAQLEAGAAFTAYLFAILRQQNAACPEPQIRCIAAYNMPKPPQGLTNLKSYKPKFSKVGNVFRSDWKLSAPLPLGAFLMAV